MENSMFVDIFLIVLSLGYAGFSYRWNNQNRDIVLKLKNDVSYSNLVILARIPFLIILAIVLVWLGFMCSLLYECLLYWKAGGTGCYLLLVLFAVITVWQIGVAHYCKLILIFAKSRGLV